MTTLLNILTAVGAGCLLAGLVSLFIAVTLTLDTGVVVEITRPDSIVVEGMTHGGEVIRERVEVRSEWYRIGDKWRRDF